MSEAAGAPDAGPDPQVPSVARMYDFFLGGKENFAVDRRAAEEVGRALPGVAGVARSNRQFLRRAVRFAAERGVEQFLDLGAGLPTQGNVHEIARSVHPGARVVYVDNDPVVTSHGRALLTGDGDAAVVDADLRDAEAVLSDPRVRELIDFDLPVCVLFVAVLHFMPDEEDPAGVIGRYRDAVPAGSPLVISHAAVEEHRNLEVEDAYRSASAPFVARTREQVTALLDGLEIVDPGVVRLHEWRPEGGEYATDAGWTAVARKGR
ncbi:SAM-dependent methyltransferase [Actinoallomurus bryophytorum]|uniref:S-adenosyl methyltransferase n=1 Tax=Actinoallomurus bryophytorum TaxID=1490222 RepID=A0A543CQ13_9ACTN|nr:SAM-dependent methyltransferase [Actinoallomurus bryophytorum]TQL99185.1 S-adenosyl methyltransferase [Actinoallomurus bryophytorum]